MVKNSEIFVLGGTHGNEPLGVALVDSLNKDPITDVDQVVANEQAATLGERYIDTNLNWQTKPEDNSYEGRRLRWLMGRCAHAGVILDFHNAAASDRAEIWLPRPSEAVKPIARWLLERTGIRHVIVDSEGTPFYRGLPPSIMIELGLPEQDYPEWERQQIEQWRKVLTEMAKVGLSHLDARLSPDTTFSEIVTEPSREEAKRARLDSLPPFASYDPLPAEAAHALGLSPDNNYRVQSSHYRNFSPKVPGTAERAYWGTIVKDIDPVL
ncbi:MAG TPA: succinylglutamate desuccinylase/aspartoacylase family protein [Candidatus Saccharimonadales bacterium]|nr:succinylglutamate desuccinylase/aspartoacylase family protein [Candidatus Saccharimonadales bacterium]